MNVPEEEQQIPGDLVDVVHEVIDRLETLHVLILLHATAPRGWSIRDVSQQRQSSAYSAELSLKRLTQAGLLVRQDELFRFQPATSELGEQAASLVWWYQTRPHTVIALIFSGQRRHA